VPTRHAAPHTERDALRLPIETVVRRLPTTQREILVETYFLGRSLEEAAQKFGIAPAEAKARLYEAMHQLAYITGATRPTRRHRREPVKELSVR
jgi:RNA polymerase sigma-70 factor, ECF subfamily